MSKSPAASAAASATTDTAWTAYEADLGDEPALEGSFTLTDAAIEATSVVVVTQAPGPYTGKGTLADEAQMDPLWCVAWADTGAAVVYWSTLGHGPVSGNVRFLYTVAN